MLLSEWLTYYLTHHTADLKDLTKASYEERLRLHVIPTIGKVKLCKLTPFIVQDFIDSLSRKTESRDALSPKTIKCIHGVLHKALNKAVGLGYLSKNPADGSTLPRIHPHSVIPLSDSQTVQFLQAIKGDRYEQVFLLALFTGLRQGELIGLTWDCINWEQNVIIVKGQLIRKRKNEIIENIDDDGQAFKLTTVKNDKIRYICVDDEIMDIFRTRLEEQNKQRKIAGDLWHEPFPNLIFENDFGKNFTHSTVRKHFKKIVAEIGLPNERFHNMRHNYTVKALEAGDDVNTVQENLGHATPNFTLKVYDHVTTERKIASAKRMNERIKELKSNID